MVGGDTGENGFFARGEFEAVTSINQMEFVTPEEIASNVVLEIKGSNTGVDVIAAIDSAIMVPSYRAGYLRGSAIEAMRRLEHETSSHSIATGELGPPTPKQRARVRRPNEAAGNRSRDGRVGRTRLARFEVRQHASLAGTISQNAAISANDSPPGVGRDHDGSIPERGDQNRRSGRLDL